jgi:hypothetical protein
MTSVAFVHMHDVESLETVPAPRIGNLCVTTPRAIDMLPKSNTVSSAVSDTEPSASGAGTSPGPLTHTSTLTRSSAPPIVIKICFMGLVHVVY